MTTNGLLLEEQLDALVEAGLDGVNISLYTSDEETIGKSRGFPARRKCCGALKKRCLLKT